MALLAEHLERGLIPPVLRPKADLLRQLSQELGYEEHVRSDYGEEARGVTPWELFQEPEAVRAIEIARRAVSLAEDFARQ